MIRDSKQNDPVVTAVSAMKSEVVTVDLTLVQSNMVYLKLDPNVMSMKQFCDRMQQVS